MPNSEVLDKNRLYRVYHAFGYFMLFSLVFAIGLEMTAVLERSRRRWNLLSYR